MRLAKTIANATDYGNVNFEFIIGALSSTALMKYFHGTCVWHNGTHVFPSTLGGLWALTTAVTAFRFFMSSGNITSGTIDLYGLTHA